VSKGLLAIFVVGLSACSQDSGSPPPAVSQSAMAPAGMSRVTDPSQVCMVNDQYMGRPQIPVVVEGRTRFADTDARTTR
jgi:hypothetical protein